MMKRMLAALAVLAATAATPVFAKPKPVTDCATRDGAFTADAPLIDLLLSPAASAILEEAMPGRLSKAPPGFMGTKTPSFAAIISLRQAGMFTGLKADEVDAIDKKLRLLPVTAADKVARCMRFDNEKPKLTKGSQRPRVLLFEKINGFFHADAVPAARAALTEMAKRKGWTLDVTDKGGAFTPSTLRKFDVVIWNNNSGDVLSLSQRAAMKAFLEQGGGFVALHGAAGDSVYLWDWYPDTLIGARFSGHPMAPQFQDARIVVNKAHPLADGLPAEWRMTDEWYSFHNNPRQAGANVLLTLDESSYKPDGMMGQNLRMGEDHPIAWSLCVGKGRAFYSAIGHMAGSYSQPQNVTVMESAISWAADRTATCSPGH